MDFRDILKSFDSLSEATTTTDKGTVHKAGAGGYGNQYGSDEVTDQYGKPKGKVSLGKLGSANEPKRGKGRPPNPDKSKSYDSSALGKAMGMGKAPKPSGKPSVKHSLKEYFDQLDQALNEAGITVKPMQGASQIIGPDGEPMGTADIATANVIKAASEKGTLNLGSDEQMAEGGDIGKHNNATTGFDALVRKLTPKYGKEAATKIAGAQLKKIKEAEAPQYFAQSSPLSTANRGVLEGKKGVNPFAKKDDKAEKIGKKVTKDIEKDEKKGSAPKKGVNPFAKKGAKPDFLDIDKDGDKKEPMKKAVKDKKKVKEGITSMKNTFVILDDSLLDQIANMNGSEVDPDAGTVETWDENTFRQLNAFAQKNPTRLKRAQSITGRLQMARPVGGTAPGPEYNLKEGMEHGLQAARLEGKSHALRKMPYNCTHDDMEEARHYHDGFKEGLDECYGQMPILGLARVSEMGQGPEVSTMASYGADDMGMEEGNAFTAGLAKTPHGGKFRVGGSSFTDRTRYDSPLDEFAFESLDKQLNSLLENVNEGMTVSISKGQQGSPDSVSVSAQDGEADQLLSIIKSAGLGLFGGEEQGFNAPQGSAGAHGGISVVDDHDGMMSLMKKLSGTGGGEMTDGGDYEDEEGSGEEDHMHGHDHEAETCESCGGMMEENHQCESDEQSVMGEDETPDQEEFIATEDNPTDSGADNTDADVAGNAAANSALATADAGADKEEGEVYSSPTEGMEDTTGEEAGTDALDEEGYYKDPDGDDESAEDQEDKKDNEKRRREEETVAESFANLYKKLAYLSEESTSEKDDEHGGGPTPEQNPDKGWKPKNRAKEVDESIYESEERPFICVHAKKGKCEVTASSSYQAAQKAAQKWGLKSTAGIDAHLSDVKKDTSSIGESYANSADDTFEADIEFMTNVISGGLNKQKSTGQTTIPVISGQKNRMGADGLGNPMKESTDLLKDYMKLSGL